MHQVSLKDIAARLGLSIATVSRALKDNKAISPQTRQLVVKTAEEMNYSKNFIADSLRSGQLPIVGVVVPHGVTHFYASVLDGIESVAAAEGYGVLCMNSHESYDEECYNLRSLVSLHVAGIVASLSQATEDYSLFREIAAEHVPVVFVARQPDTAQFSAVTADNEQAAYNATTHLARSGCRHIALLCGPRRLHMGAERRRGYLTALHDAGFPVRPELVAYTDIDNASAIDAVNDLLDLDTPPDGIVALNDTLLMAAFRAVKTRPLRMPDDVALIGFSDERYVCDIQPSVSTVEDQSREMGEAACRQLLAEIRGSSEPRRIIVPTRLQVRQSSRRKV